MGTQAIVTVPRCESPVPLTSLKVAASSSSNWRALGSKPAPAAVSETERVVRSSSCTPNCDSRFINRRVSAGEVTLSMSAARAKLPQVATPTKACMPSTSSFMTISQQSVQSIHFTDR